MKRGVLWVDSAFVVDIFRVSFGREELSEESSEIGTGRIMPLISTRRQDWESARFQLAEMYPEFLREAPRDAARALIATVEGYVVNRRRVRTAEEAEEVFEGLGERLTIQEDYSSVWDSEGAPGIDEAQKMLDALEKFVEGGGQKKGNAEEVDPVLDVLVKENRLAAIWRRLLRMGARFPATVGERLRFLAWARPILRMRDTSSEAGEFLRALYSRLSLEEKTRVERTIMTFGGETGERTRTRDRLLGCLPVDGLVTEEAGNVLRDLAARNAIPQNIPVVRFSSGWVGRYSEEEDLADEGVPVSQEANRRIRELERPLKAFNEKFLNSAPSAEQTSGISEALEALGASLREGDPGVHEKQRNYAWGTLAATCAAIAKGDALDCGSQIGATVRDCLLLASAEAVPEPDPEHDARFDESPSWGGPAARVEAAAGLTHLLYHSTCGGQDVEAAVERLLVDPVPAVRFQVTLRLAALYRTKPELMWRLIENTSERDSSTSVLNALLVGPIVRLAGRHPEEAGRVARRILHRVELGSPGAGEARKAAVGVLVGLDVWRQNRGAREEVDGILGGLPLTADLVRDIISNLRDAVASGPAANPDRTQEDVRRRAISIVGRVLDAVVLVVREFDQRLAVPGRQLSDSERAELQIYVRLADHIATELYFASGAYDARNERGPEAGVMRRFWEEGRGLLASLAAIGYPSVVHHLLETLEALVAFDPREVFLLIQLALQAGARGGYQYEPLGAKLFVALVERYLAEYGALLRTDPDCRHALLAALDIFVRAGWPDARRLTYRLDEIFR
jgi:hypothetical protein